MNDRPKSPVVPPAVAKWQEQETRWKEEASEWVRKTLSEYFATDASSEPHTAGEILAMLDQDPSVPTGYARLVKSDTASYNARYALVRNTLEGFARKRQVVLDTTINAKGNDKATTYARPRDASREWQIEIDAESQTSANRARAAVVEWLTLEGASVDGVDSILLVRKADRGLYGGGSKAAPGISLGVGASRNRRRRTTT